MNRADPCAEKRVGRRMAVTVVDLIESVDVNVGEHESAVAAPRAGNLALEEEQFKLATESPGQLIKLGASKLDSGVVVIERRGHAIRDGLLAILGSEAPISGSLTSVLSPPVGV